MAVATHFADDGNWVKTTKGNADAVLTVPQYSTSDCRPAQ